jgi:glycosyltransferase involved in cell wall biosynthesis
MKRVLIAIPNYNNQNYILDTIESVFSSLVDGFKVDIVVFDNCSTDDTVPLLERNFCGNDVSIVINESNVGSLQNHNRCIDYAISNSYDYLKILSSDDVLLPNCLQMQVDFLEKNNQCDVVTCNMIVCDQFLNPIREHNFLGSPGIPVPGRYIVSKCAIDAKNHIGGPSNIMVRVAAISDIRFDSSMRWLADLKFSCQLILNGVFINIGIVGVKYRRHPNTDSADISSVRGMMLDNNLRFVKEFNGGMFGLYSAYKIAALDYMRSLRNKFK